MLASLGANDGISWRTICKVQRTSLEPNSHNFRQRKISDGVDHDNRRLTLVECIVASAEMRNPKSACNAKRRVYGQY